MTSTKLPGLALALVALTPAGCGGAVEGTGTDGSSTTGGQGAGGGTGGQTATGGGGGTGGQTATGGGGGTGGQTTTGGGGTGGCASACVTSADCPADLPVCASVGTGCNLCLGPCNGAQCMGSNTCLFDADCPPDGKCVCGPSGCTMCVIGITSDLPGFPAALGEGVWLIGWSGGLDHYSWVRFSFLTTTTGTFTLLDPVGVTLTPFYPCEGSGPFTVNLVTGGVVLTLPAGCDTPEAYLDFLSFSDPGGFPPHAVVAASILTMGQTISGFQHDAGFCDAGFTMCGDPFLP